MSDVAKHRLSWADAGRILLVGVLGSLIGLGLGNAVGTASDLGLLDVTTRLTVGVGSTFDVGVAALRVDTPGPVGLSVTANDVRFSDPADLADTLTSFGDVEAVAATLFGATLGHLRDFALVGGLIGLLLALATHRPLFGRHGPTPVGVFR